MNPHQCQRVHSPIGFFQRHWIPLLLGIVITIAVLSVWQELLREELLIKARTSLPHMILISGLTGAWTLLFAARQEKFDLPEPAPFALPDIALLQKLWLSELEEAVSCDNDQFVVDLITQSPSEFAQLSTHRFEQILKRLHRLSSLPIS